MRVGIKAKQVAGVTLIVALAVVVQSGWYLSSVARVLLSESEARADLLANVIRQRAFQVVRDAQAIGEDPYAALHADASLQTILESSAFDKVLLYAAIVDTKSIVIAHSDPPNVGQTLPQVGDLAELIASSPYKQARAIYTGGGLNNFDHQMPLRLGDTDFGSIRVGVSTIFIREVFKTTLTIPLYTAIAVIVVAILVAMLLAQIVLRPIHVISSGLARLGRGEVDVKVDLPPGGELGDLGDSFKAVTARLAEDRTQIAGERETLASVVDHLEDAVGLFAPDGTLLFANPSMRAAWHGDTGRLLDLLPATHPYRVMVEETLANRQPRGPVPVKVPDAGDRLVVTHNVEHADGRLMGVMLVARNLAYLSQVESTLNYSRKLAALGRLSAGIAHEVKNPLNATMIHLELLKMQLAGAPAAAEHLAVIAAQVRRLDEVVQGFLRFIRPEDLKLRPVALAPLFEEMMTVVQPEAESTSVDVTIDCPPDLPPVSADPGLLQQAFLNLALNACQAMPNGGKLRISAAESAGQHVDVVFDDTGIGIEPAALEHIFDLYFTTKETGSGIGLSMVYRTVQLHDAEIEVQSVPGRGTTFRVKLRQA